MNEATRFHLGGAAVAWPLAARAQRGERIRRIGVLMSTTPDDAEGQARIAAFLKGLQQSGWAVPGNVRLDVRWTAGNVDAARKYATELVALATWPDGETTPIHGTRESCA